MKRLFGSLFGQKLSVTRATALLAITALLSNVFGLVRNVVFYHVVSPDKLDIYFASFRIPDLIFNVLILGAISSAFIPILSDLLSKKQEDHVWEVSDQVISWLTVSFAAIAIILFFIMPALMRVVVSGFDQDRLQSAISLSRILLLQSIFFAWSWTFGGILNSFRRFSGYAVAPLLYNASIIVGGLFAKKYGISSIAWSVVIGAVLHMGIQFIEVRRLGYSPKFDLRLTEEVKEILKLMVPRSISQGIAQIELIILTALGSGLVFGSIAIFNGMNDLQTTPTVIIANSLAVAFFPALTSFAAKEDWPKMNALLNKVIRSALYLLLPCILFAFAIRSPLIHLYTNSHLVSLAIATFAWFLVGVIPTALVVLLARVFYSVKDTKTPLILNIIGAVAGTIVAVVGIKIYHGEVPILALATSVEDWVQCILYFFFLYKLQPQLIPIKTLIGPVAKYLIGSLIMAFCTWAALHGIASSMTHHSDTQVALIELFVGAVVAVLSYYLYSKVVHQEELGWLKKNTFTKPQ